MFYRVMFIFVPDNRICNIRLFFSHLSLSLSHTHTHRVFPMKLTLNATDEMETLKFYPNFRFFMTNRGAENEPMFDLPNYNSSTCDTKVENGCNKWFSSESAMNTNFIEDFSAVCFMTVRDVARLHIGDSTPVALIQSAVGGTRVEAWMSKSAIVRASKLLNNTLPPPASNAVNKVNVLYNAMVSPFNSMAVRAALWYQGEANADQIDPVSKIDYYTAYLGTMIETWREVKGMGDFSFFVVTLPPSQKNGTSCSLSMHHQHTHTHTQTTTHIHHTQEHHLRLKLVEWKFELRKLRLLYRQ
jgi:hypothetical protein